MLQKPSKPANKLEGRKERERKEGEGRGGGRERKNLKGRRGGWKEVGGREGERIWTGKHSRANNSF